MDNSVVLGRFLFASGKKLERIFEHLAHYPYWRGFKSSRGDILGGHPEFSRRALSRRPARYAL